MKSLLSFAIFAVIVQIPKFCSSQTLPIKPTRTITFSTIEGSYMNVDVSPDGRTILFDLLGDIYSLPATGGQAKQLTRGIALHVRPIWSGDGSKFLFMSDEGGTLNLTVQSIDGALHSVLSNIKYTSEFAEWDNYGLDAVWDPLGKYIFFNSQLISLYRRQIENHFIVPNPIRFSTDGKTLYGIDSNRIFKYQKESPRATPISPALSKYYAGYLSPDGRWWCYIADSNSKLSLIARNLSTNSVRLLVPSLIQTDPRYKPNLPAQHFSFSPDSRSLYIGYGGKIHCIDLEKGDNRIIPFKASVKVDLGPYVHNNFPVALDSFSIKFARSASASPDGKHLVFSALGQIYIMDLPNGKPHLLAPQPFGQFQPSWSPDGRWLAYVSWCDTVGGFVWMVAAKDSQPKKMTDIPAQYQRPTWSPDGLSVAVLKGEPPLGGRDYEGRGQIILLSPKDSASTLVDDSIPLINNILTFSADGKNIYYTRKDRSRSGSTVFPPDLVAKNLQTNVMSIVATNSGVAHSAQKSVSPNGHYLVYSLDEDLYLVPLPWVGNEIPLFKNGNWLGIRFATGVDPVWMEGGKILGWTYGNKFYEIDPEKVVAAAQRLTQSTTVDSKPSDNPLTITVRPTESLQLTLKVATAYAHGVIALRNARIITMEGNKLFERGTILIINGRIAALGPNGAVTIPRMAHVLDLSGATIMPGLIDLHLHMYQTAPDIFYQQSWQFQANFAYGVTTARDPSMSFGSFGYAELLKSGRMIGPRLYSVGFAVRFDDGVVSFNSLTDATAVVNKRKTCGGSEIKQYTLPTRIQRQWLLQACRQAHMNMTNEGGWSPLAQLAMVKDGSTGIEHNAAFGDVYNDYLSLWSASHTYLTATLQVCYGADEGNRYFVYKYWRHPDNKWLHFVYNSYPTGYKINHAEGTIEDIMPKDTVHPGFLAPAAVDNRLRRMGGRIVVGSHGNDQGIGIHNEIWALQMGGFSNLQALQAATIEGAKALGIDKDLGSLQVGKIADLLVLNSNPLDDIHNTKDIRYIMQGGILYDAQTLNTLWPTAKKCPSWILPSTLAAP